MSRDRTPVRPVSAPLADLESGQLADFYALLSGRTRSTTRDGKPFFNCRFRDARRVVAAMIWADSDYFRPCEMEWQVGQAFKLRASYSHHEKYGPQIEIHKIRHVSDQDREDGFREADLRETSRLDPDEGLNHLKQLADTEIVGEPLKSLVLAVYNLHADRLKTLPASPRHFYPYPGGWLEHTLSVTKNCILLADRYREQYPDSVPPLNRDLILAGAMLHEIGRVAELEATPEPEQTIPGRMFGHQLLGRDLVREAAKEIAELDAELLQLLEHLLLSYLTLPEWGSVRLPLIPEVLILHHADDLDAKLEMYMRCLRKDASEGPFTERDPILGKALLKLRAQ